jgi:hypothetical protein
MDPLLQARLESAGRAVILGCGAIAAATGHHLSDATTAAITEGFGGFLVLLSVGLSQWNVYQTEQATRLREAVAVRVGQTVADGVIGPTPLATASEVPALIKVIAPKLPPIDALPNPIAGH